MSSLYTTTLVWKGSGILVPTRVFFDQRGLPRAEFFTLNSWEFPSADTHTYIHRQIQTNMGKNARLYRYRVVYVLSFLESIKGLDVHHRDLNPLNDSPENLIALARRFHHDIHLLLGDNHFEWYTHDGISPAETFPQELFQPFSKIIID